MGWMERASTGASVDPAFNRNRTVCYDRAEKQPAVPSDDV